MKPRRRNRRGWAVPGFLLLATLLAAGSGAQEAAPEEPEAAAPPTIFDLARDVRNPDELHPEKNFQNNWRRIWRAFGMRAHLYPSQVTGPENWPPHLYGGGMNYSIWRNPVTGWPEF